jgi:hypothetical protein
MKKLFLLSVVIGLVACGPSKRETELENKLSAREICGGFRNCHIVVLDSCEYVLCNAPEAIAVTHHANCKNH